MRWMSIGTFPDAAAGQTDYQASPARSSTPKTRQGKPRRVERLSVSLYGTASTPGHRARPSSCPDNRAQHSLKQRSPMPAPPHFAHASAANGTLVPLLGISFYHAGHKPVAAQKKRRIPLFTQGLSSARRKTYSQNWNEQRAQALATRFAAHMQLLARAFHGSAARPVASYLAAMRARPFAQTRS